MPAKPRSKLNAPKKRPKCTQCEKTALLDAEGIPLCLDCYAKLEYIRDLNLSRLIDLTNYNSAKMDRSLGLGASPKMANFVPKPPPGALFLNNISVKGNNFGTINTGTIQSLDNAITIINKQSHPELASQLKQLIEAVLKSNELTAEAQAEVAESLSFIADQLTKPKQERKTSLARTIVDNLPGLLKSASALLTLWNQLTPLITVILNK